MYTSYNFQLVILLPAMSLGLRFCTSRMGRTRGDRWVSTLGQDTLAASTHSRQSSKNSPQVQNFPALSVGNTFPSYVGNTLPIPHYTILYYASFEFPFLFLLQHVCSKKISKSPLHGWLQWHLCEV